MIVTLIESVDSCDRVTPERQRQIPAQNMVIRAARKGITTSRPSSNSVCEQLAYSVPLQRPQSAEEPCQAVSFEISSHLLENLPKQTDFLCRSAAHQVRLPQASRIHSAVPPLRRFGSRIRS